MDKNARTIMLHMNTLRKGGAERVFVQLAERFAENGWRTILVVSFFDSSKPQYELSDQVICLALEESESSRSRLKKNVSRIKKLRALCRRYKPEILLSCMQEPNFRALLAAAALPVKNLVGVCSAPEREYPGKLGHIVATHLMPRAEGCVFQTQEQKDYFPEKLQNKSRIIMNQVNESFFEAKHEGERRDIVAVGRLNHAKNQAMLIHAFSHIADKTDANLLIYGMGELYDKLDALIKELRLEERIKLMGSTNDVAGAIKGAKLFAMSSDYEGLPNALLEAMALGLPIVSTDCKGGGPRMVIRHGENGLLCPVGDDKAFAASMLRLLNEPETAAALGRAAKLSAENFRPESVFRLWEEYVEEIIK